MWIGQYSRYDRRLCFIVWKKICLPCLSKTWSNVCSWSLKAFCGGGHVKLTYPVILEMICSLVKDWWVIIKRFILMNVITLALTMATSSQTNLTGTPGRYYYKILMFVLFQQVIKSSFVTSGLGASLPTLLLCKKNKSQI